MKTVVTLIFIHVVLLLSEVAFGNEIPTAGHAHNNTSSAREGSSPCSSNTPSPSSTVESLSQLLEATFFTNESIESVIERYNIRKGATLSGTVIVLRLRPENWKYYVQLQQKIATLIPKESKRPTIDLVVTSSPEESVDNSIGIAGGTGPLSDAALLDSIMTQVEDREIKIPWNNFAINLFSAPPPRDPAALLRFVAGYLEKMGAFTSRRHDRYYMASNTAHAKIGEFRTLVSTSTALRHGVTARTGDVVDLVEEVTDRVSAIHRVPVLVLGTLQAYLDRLYPTYLSRKGFDDGEVMEPRQHSHHQDSPREMSAETTKFYTIENAERAIELQKAIDEAKSGEVEKAGEQIEAIVRREIKRIQETKEIQKDQPMKIVLGCTEIPMALAGEPLERLKREFPHLEFINSEAIFAIRISNDIAEIYDGQGPVSTSMSGGYRSTHFTSPPH